MIYTAHAAQGGEVVDPADETFDGVTHKIFRRCALTIEGYAKANDNLDNTLDLIASEVEVAMDGDEDIGGLAEASTLIGTEMEFTGEAENEHGLVRLTYEVQYRTARDDPDTLLT